MSACWDCSRCWDTAENKTGQIHAMREFVYLVERRDVEGPQGSHSVNIKSQAQKSNKAGSFPRRVEVSLGGWGLGGVGLKKTTCSLTGKGCGGGGGRGEQGEDRNTYVLIILSQQA